MNRATNRASLTRLRPYALCVLAVVLVVFFPGRERTKSPSDQGVSTVAPSRDTTSAVPGAGATDTASAPAEGTSAAVPRGPSGAVAPPRATRQPAASPVVTSPPVSTPKGASQNAAGAGAAGGPMYPGIGTPEAIANPQCDPKTGRIRMPGTAPLCVVAWPKGQDNGGATSAGVTAKTIRIVWHWPNSRPNAERDQMTKDYFNIYNKHLELWGRQVELISFSGTGNDEIAYRADAVKIADLKPFLVVTPIEITALELAHRKVIAHISTIVPFKHAQALAPYLYSTGMDDKLTIANVAEWVGKRIVGRPARWAGDVTYQAQTRKFGLIYQSPGWDRDMWNEAAAKHGVTVAQAEAYSGSGVGGNAAQVQERMRIIISKFKDAGVTSIINGSDLFTQIVLTKEATNQLYNPEWVQTGWSYQDLATFARLADPLQMAHAFGIGTLGPAVRTGTPDLYNWQYGRSTPASQAVDSVQVAVASSIVMPCLQLAGPTLTPQGYRSGCFADARSGYFCKCKVGTALSYGRWATPWDDFSGFDDMTEKWWDANWTGPDELGLSGRGIFMKVDGGTRYIAGEWPTGEPRMFDPNGAVAVYDSYPPGEQPPMYPNNNPG